MMWAWHATDLSQTEDVIDDSDAVQNTSLHCSQRLTDYVLEYHASKAAYSKRNPLHRSTLS